MAKFVAIFAVFEVIALVLLRHGARNPRLNRCPLTASAAGHAPMVERKFEAGFNVS
ncbi:MULTISPECIES: hypothetical protein [unclassified Bradyrhizobium]|uniref:hypothetical protein n=1 Tax=unclassified Bradyrhizobium TaxID=2631580 RepID=UPI0028E79AC5|nr:MULTISPECIES: hypothetical protein [unclassified Bradyrhizobium]